MLGVTLEGAVMSPDDGDRMSGLKSPIHQVLTVTLGKLL